MKYDRKSGAWYRPSDKLIIDEVPGVYGNVPITKSDIVLDLGAHIGLTSRLFLSKGARHSIAVEADPANLPLLRKNLARLPATILPAAVGPKPGRTEFYTRSDRGFVGSILEDKDRKKLMVPVVPFSGLLSQYRPTIIKADTLIKSAIADAKQEGATELEVISDSLLLVQQMLGVYKVKHPNLVPLHQKARTMVRDFKRFSIRHTLRAGNKNADRLANVAVDRGEGRSLENRRYRRDRLSHRREKRRDNPRFTPGRRRSGRRRQRGGADPHRDAAR